MRIYFSCDHHGNDLKPKLLSYTNKLGYKGEDLGGSKDFPLAAQKVAISVLKHKGGVGILMCGTGQGVAMAANRYPGIRAALCSTVAEARQAREHLDANVLTLSADVLSLDLAKKIVKTFLTVDFTKKTRYKRRIRQMER